MKTISASSSAARVCGCRASRIRGWRVRKLGKKMGKVVKFAGAKVD